MAKYLSVVLLFLLGGVMLLAPKLLCKIKSFLTGIDSEPSDYRLSFVRLRGFFVVIAAVLLAFFL